MTKSNKKKFSDELRHERQELYVFYFLNFLDNLFTAAPAKLGN